MKIEARLCLAIALAVAGSAAFAQGWAPQKNIEIVAGSAPGGSNDKTARAMERTMRSSTSRESPSSSTKPAVR